MRSSKRSCEYMGGTFFKRNDNHNGLHPLFRRISTERSREGKLQIKLSPSGKQNKKTKKILSVKIIRNEFKKQKFTPKTFPKSFPILGKIQPFTAFAKHAVQNGWGGEICKERSDGIAFCSTKNYIFLAKRVTPGQLKRNFLTFREENSRSQRGHKESSRICLCGCFLYPFGWGGEIFLLIFAK